MIVPLSPEHIDGVYKIETESFSDPWSKDAFIELLNNPFAVCFCFVNRKPDMQNTDTTTNTEAEELEEVIGYIMMYHVLSEGQIINIAVGDAYRGQKIASKMIETALEYAKNEDIEIISLEVRESNIPAIELYRKFCFKKIGIRKNYYKLPVENAVLMELRIINNG